MIKESKPLYITSVLTNKCPRFRKGDLFQTNKAYDLKNNLTMNEHCPVCGQPSEIEVGFYYGTGYVSYALSVAFLVATFVAWWILFGISFSNNSIFWWLGTACTLLILLQPPMMRVSRSLWLSWFVKYDANWKEHKLEEPERVIKEQMNNW
jgi:rRNA maturation protein Nop10